MQMRRQGEGRAAASRRARREGMSDTRRMTFLEALRRTSDVRLAAEEAGTSSQAAYGLRDRDAACARAWQAAILGGYEDLELRLLAAARGCPPVQPAPGVRRIILSSVWSPLSLLTSSCRISLSQRSWRFAPLRYGRRSICTRTVRLCYRKP